jgi:hypothetical protein
MYDLIVKCCKIKFSFSSFKDQNEEQHSISSGFCAVIMLIVFEIVTDPKAQKLWGYYAGVGMMFLEVSNYSFDINVLR